MESKKDLEQQVKNILDVQNRRLDELAWLLEGNGACTAVAVVNGKFYIAANGFSTKTKTRDKNQQLNHACSLMEHFSIIAKNDNIDSNNEIIQTSRVELIRNVFKKQLSVQTKGGIRVSEEMINTIITNASLINDDLPLLPGKLEKHVDSAHIVFGSSKLIFNRIRKIENSIIKARQGIFEDIRPDMLEAFKNFNHNDDNRDESNILFFELGQGVHAELQIMNRLLDLFGDVNGLFGEVYIGISKRCCFNCNILLNAANNILHPRNAHLYFEGTHGLSFEGKWIPPDGFKRISKTDRELAKLPIANNIKDEICDEYRKIKKTAKNKNLEEAKNEEESEQEEHIDQRHERSSSTHSLNAVEKQALYKKSIEEKYLVLQELELLETPQAKILSLGLELLQEPLFVNLFDIEPGLVDVQKTRLLPIINAAEENIKKKLGIDLDRSILEDFFSNPKYCGEHLFNLYAGIEPEQKRLKMQ